MANLKVTALSCFSFSFDFFFSIFEGKCVFLASEFHCQHQYQSEFNFRCFLRSRCSMEMWCSDDTGRDSWDWVGPPNLGESVI